VIDTKKSQAAIAVAWLRTKWPSIGRCLLRTDGFWSMYLLTVLGETRIPSLSFSSAAIHSWPQVGLPRAISRISLRKPIGSRGRSRFRDFRLQRARNTVRYHLRKVSGRTTTIGYANRLNFSHTLCLPVVVGSALSPVGAAMSMQSARWIG
jgi:hypothetical protein